MHHCGPISLGIGPFRAFVLLLCLGAIPGMGKKETVKIDHGKDLMYWLRTSPLEYIHPKLELRRRDSEKEKKKEEVEMTATQSVPSFAMYTTAKISAGELLVQVPESIIYPRGKFQTGDRVIQHFDGEPYEGVIMASTFHDLHDIQFDDGDQVLRVPRSELWTVTKSLTVCLTVDRLLEEWKKGEQSEYAPELLSLLDRTFDSNASTSRSSSRATGTSNSNIHNNSSHLPLPANWSTAGKNVLLEIIGMTLKGRTGHLLPPYDPFLLKQPYCSQRGWLEEQVQSWGAQIQWEIQEDQSPSPLSSTKLESLLEKMRNGSRDYGNITDESNAEQPKQWDDLIRVHAHRDLPAGTEVFTYTFCRDCERRNLTYGTAETFRDYGYVEEYPQRWVFPQQEVIFDIALEEPQQSVLKLEWVEGHILQLPEHVAFFREQNTRLEYLRDTVLGARDPAIPDHEWNVLIQYHGSLSTAIRLALDALDWERSGETECSSGACGVTMTRYDPLQPEGKEYWGITRPETCGDVMPEVFLETIHSPYQKISYHINPAMDPPDMCFSLDDIWQICTSYRPQYHEMAVHYTARFLPALKRVLFVGGGDSMLLHDILKYPTLEKVVGLEIDQAVTRGAFRYFGAQPHFDDDRVEWWFGDAAKSMLVLPNHYYGSFDLVLVDLSETITGLSVTKGLDIFTALSLLVKHDGILVKNEYMYFPKQKDVFRHALHIHYYNVDVVCSQSLMLGSHGVDLLRGEFRDHGVHHMLELLDDPHVRYQVSRDYQKNVTNPQNLCIDHTKDDIDASHGVQESSPGITMIVDAENTTVDIPSSQALSTLVENALKQEGLTVLSSITSPNTKLPAAITILGEGYVVARAMPEYLYCAFDIHLWSRFEKQESAKRALIKAVGSSVSGPSSSSYRVVTGGMFGVSTWKEDEKNRGPKLDDCHSRDTSISDKNNGEGVADEAVMPLGVVDDAALSLVVTESMSMIRNESGFLVTVICGDRSKPCAAVEALLLSGRGVDEVVPLYQCSGIASETEFSENAADHLLACEKATWLRLETITRTKQIKVRAVVVDPEASRSFATVLNAICISAVAKSRFFADNLLVVAPSFEANESWRRVFVDSFRKHVYPTEPSFKADISFRGSSGHPFMFLSIFSSGNDLFFEHLVEFVAAVERRGQLAAEVDNIRGGEFLYQDPFVAKQTFKDADFDQSNPLKQWKSQKSLGLQTIFQFEVTKRRVRIFANFVLEGIKETLIECLEEPLLAKVRDWDEMGDGNVITALWPGGQIVAQWDGRNHIDINLFTYEEDFGFAEKLEVVFINKVLGISRTLRDVQPRGIGRVVNFSKDIPTGSNPRWV